MRCTLDEVLPRGTGPDLRLHRGDVLRPEFRISGEGTRLEQSLELPALGPAVVVREMGCERADQSTLLSLWTQRGIDLPERRFHLDRVEVPHGLAREPGRDVDGTRLRDDLFVAAAAHEDHVDVADVVQLPSAGFSHSDDGETGRRHLIPPHRLLHPGPRHRERRLQGSTREVG